MIFFVLGVTYLILLFKTKIYKLGKTKPVLVEKTIYPENPVAENTKNSFGFGDSPEGNID